MSLVINSFNGEYRFLSNFWPCTVIYEGLEFNCVEAAFVAAKTTDIEKRRHIQALKSPGECKKFGRKIKLRENWDKIKIEIMNDLLKQKFAKGSQLGDMLVKTRDMHLIEGNTWGDTFWGVCYGVGQNVLGLMLMEIRNSIK